jgi:undecaprenyl-diphosphatase
MPALFQAAILGIIQGLTEFLPISSTAHLLIAGRLLGHADPGGAFTVLIQLGAVLAVIWLYRTKILEVAAGLASKPEARHFALMLALAFLPSAIAGVFLADYIKSVLYSSFRAIAVAFVAGGVVMLLVERRRPAPVVTSADRVPLGRALGIGIFQMLALVPGVSRSGATIVGGMLLGLDRRAAAEFSFFLAMPTMVGAFAHDLFEVRDQLDPARAGEIAVGFALAFAAALLVVKPFLNVVSRFGFEPFALYRIAAGVLLFVAVVSGWR